jgi:CDP-diacylglycerol--glycerol-3-phosphate 3-phosphatidyltransferase
MQVHLDLLTASPMANGFFGARGVSGWIPTAYSLLEQGTWRRLNRAWGSRQPTTGGGGKAPPRRRLLEYSRPGWEFHAKGIWCRLFCVKQLLATQAHLCWQRSAFTAFELAQSLP